MNKNQTILLIIKAILVLVFILMLFLVFGGILQFLWFKQQFNWLTGTIVDATGMNTWLARTLAILGVASIPVIFRAFAPLALPDWLRNALGARQKKTARYQFYVIFAASCLLMFALTKDNLLGKWYLYDAINNQIMVYDKGGVDPKTLIDRKPIETPQVAQEIRLFIALQKGEGNSKRYYDDRGIPLFRYYKGDNGVIELFPKFEVIHPRYGYKMEPITAEIIKAYEKQQSVIAKIPENQRDKIDLNPPGPPPPPHIAPTKNVALSITESIDGNPSDGLITQSLIEKLQQVGYNVKSSKPGTSESQAYSIDAGILINGTVKCKVTDLGDELAGIGNGDLGQSARGITKAETTIQLTITNTNKHQSTSIYIPIPKGQANNRSKSVEASLQNAAEKVKAEIIEKINKIS